jgi:hypothetical protein
MHPYFDCCLYFFNLLAVLAEYLCEFHTKQGVEPCSVPVRCLPHTFLQSIVCRSAANSLKSWMVALLLQDRWQEGTFKFSLLPSEIAFILSIIYDNLVIMKDYFSMSNSSVLPKCTEGLLIRVQPNTYIEKTEHFWTALHLVKQRDGWTKVTIPKRHWKFSLALLAFTVFSLDYATNPIGRISPPTSPLLRNWWSVRWSNLAWGPFLPLGVPTSFRESCSP